MYTRYQPCLPNQHKSFRSRFMTSSHLLLLLQHFLNAGTPMVKNFSTIYSTSNSYARFEVLETVGARARPCNTAVPVRCVGQTTFHLPHPREVRLLLGWVPHIVLIP